MGKKNCRVKALPLRIPTQSGNVSGDLILESLDRLSINGIVHDVFVVRCYDVFRR